MVVGPRRGSVRLRRSMSRKPAKRQHGSTTKPRRNNAPAAARPASSTLADLQQQVSALTRELAEARKHLAEATQQQTATSDVLQIISSSPGDLEPVFQAMLANATRICGAKFGVLWLAEGESFRSVAMYGPSAHVEERQREPVIHPSPEAPLRRVARTKQVIHIADLREEEEYIKGFRPLRALVDAGGARTLLLVPMLRENSFVGAITIYSQKIRRFTHKQIELVQNFANQAVIAIENVRLLNELRESLQQQTATADVLRVISSSPGELEPVFRGMLANATRLCDASYGALWLCEGDGYRTAALHGPLPEAYLEQLRPGTVYHPQREVPLVRATKTRQAVQVADLSATRAYL